MKNQLSNKFAAAALALSINGMLFGSVAYIFANEANAATPVVAFVQPSDSLASTTEA
jgi:hypothetical protein